MAEPEGCRKTDLSALRKLPYFSDINIAKSVFGTKFTYLHPIDNWANHITWTNLSGSESGNFFRKRMENGITNIFKKYPGEIVIAANMWNPDYVWLCSEFDLDTAEGLMMGQGYSSRIIALHTTRRLVFLQDLDLEYCLLCRDPVAYPEPFPDVTDEVLRKEFWEQESGWLDDADAELIARHIRMEILPYTLEKTRD